MHVAQASGHHFDVALEHLGRFKMVRKGLIPGHRRDYITDAPDAMFPIASGASSVLALPDPGPLTSPGQFRGPLALSSS